MYIAVWAESLIINIHKLVKQWIKYSHHFMQKFDKQAITCAM